jgi:uncharacterized protein (UPF0332 family)
MDWRECIDKRIIKKIHPDLEMAKSLIKMSENKLKSEEKLPMSNITAASKISLAYDSLRELLEALSLKKGYKIYNHECYVAFLKEILKEDALAEEFNEIRIIRNEINYYGKEINVDEARAIIRRIKRLRHYVLKLLEN